MLDQRDGGRLAPFVVATIPGELDTVALAAAGDAEAFAALYERYLGPVYRFMAARTGSPEEAADLTQQVFLNAFRAIRRYRAGRAGFAPWLFRIARNLSTDVSRRRRPTLPIDELPSAFQEAPHASPEAAAIQGERVRTLHAEVAKLDPEKQELLALRYAAGLSSREIAAVVGKSEAAVKKQLSRLIEALKEQYID
jgi:RNA polymerase sigma-70 factor (ECF subfamily)